MPAGQAEEIIALALVFVVHVVGAGMLVWALRDADQCSGRNNRPGPPRPPRGGDDDGPDRPSPPPDGGPGIRAPLPLGETAPSRARLRDTGRAADAYRRLPRRPEHAPAPAAVPEHRNRA